MSTKSDAVLTAYDALGQEMQKELGATNPALAAASIVLVRGVVEAVLDIRDALEVLAAKP